MLFSAECSILDAAKLAQCWNSYMPAAQRFSARAWCVSAVTCYNGHQNKHCSHMWSEKGLRHHQDHVCMICAILKSLWIWSGVWTDRSGFLFHMRLRSSLRLLPHSDRWEQQQVKSNDLKNILFCKVQYNKVADETGVASVIRNLVQCKQKNADKLTAHGTFTI